MILADLHVHTYFSSDSDTLPKFQIEKALEIGLKSICITDHQDYDAAPWIPYPHLNFLLKETGDAEPYFKELLELKDEYAGRIEVLIGIELGLQKHLVEKFERFLTDHPFDFVIGSTHRIGDFDCADKRFDAGRTAKEIYTDYFLAEVEAIRAFSGFDVIGHIDFVMRHLERGLEPFKYSDYGDIIDEMLKIMIDQGRGIECNTTPLVKGIPEPNPNLQILRRYKELGGEIITFGSDSHETWRIGENFDIAMEMVKACGFQYYTVFRQRKPYFYKM